MITKEDILKVIDFGLARKYGNQLLETCCGTPLYSAPEQFYMMYISSDESKSEGLDSSVDIWAIGAILYEMVTGVAAF